MITIKLTNRHNRINTHLSQNFHKNLIVEKLLYAPEGCAIAQVLMWIEEK